MCAKRFGVGTAAIVLGMALGGAAQAQQAGFHQVNTGYFGDVAIKGYDPVAYFTDGAATQGAPEHTHRWLGATWRFASEAHRAMFAAEPMKYAPQYGGHCADGVSFGTITTNIDPTAWRIIEGKLYLNYDPGAAEGFEKSPDKLAESIKLWPAVQAALAERN